MKTTEVDEKALFTCPWDVNRDMPPFMTGYRQMVPEYYVQRTRRAAGARKKTLRAIRDRAAAEEYRDGVRAKIRRAFSPFPERTPLDARVTGVLTRDGYRVEKLRFESRPGCLVTANLYLPAAGPGPYPGVIGVCGHSQTGKAEPNYQKFCQRLAHAGIVALIFDPFSQGERDQYFRLPADEPVRQQCTTAHTMMGRQLALVGEFFGAWRAWDGMRALDYLLARPEIDAARVGVTGNSGGGTMTTWLWALDDRLAVAAPSCFVTTFLANQENELSSDYEQCPPGVIGAGLEMGDFFLARAPAPVILLGQHYDFFDERGLREIHGEVRDFYRHFEAEDDAALFVGPHMHGYFPENQRAMADFFCRRFGLPVPGEEPRFNLEKPEDLFALPGGQVVADGARPVYELTGEKARALAGARPRPGMDGLRAQIGRVLVLPGRGRAPGYRILRAYYRPGRDLYARYAVETEPGILVILRRRIGEQRECFVLEPETAVDLYLPHLSAEQETLSPPPPLAGFLPVPAPGRGFYALDPRGLGESLPHYPTVDFFEGGWDYSLHAFANMLGEPYLGRRLHDVLATLDLLADRGAETVHLHGYGQGALLAVLAAVVHPRAGRVRVRAMPPSWLELAGRPVVRWPAANFPPGVLAAFDLDDCLAALGDRVEQV